MLEVPREGLRLLLSDGGEGAELEHLAGGGEEVRRRCWGGDEGVEGEEGEFGFGEEGGGLAVGGGVGLAKLLEDGMEV